MLDIHRTEKLTFLARLKTNTFRVVQQQPFVPPPSMSFPELPHKFSVVTQFSLVYQMLNTSLAFDRHL